MSTTKTAKPLPVAPLTTSEKCEVLTKIRAKNPQLTIRELATMTGISPSYVSKLLKRGSESGPATASNS